MLSSSAALPMPAEIAKVILEIQSQVGILAKNERNEHGDYQYTNVDKFFEAVGPICADCGLHIHASPIKTTYDKIETDRGLKVAVIIAYRFRLVHAESGQNWVDPDEQPEVRMWWTGAQTYGAAQSYAIKQYMRGLFKIATGDRDADEGDQDIRRINEDIGGLNTERKKRGRPPTSKVVSLDVGNGSGKQAIAIDDAKETLLPYLGTLNRDRLRAWKEKNEDGLKSLYDLDKSLFLEVKEYLENKL